MLEHVSQTAAIVIENSTRKMEGKIGEIHTIVKDEIFKVIGDIVRDMKENGELPDKKISDGELAEIMRLSASSNKDLDPITLHLIKEIAGVISNIAEHQKPTYH